MKNAVPRFITKFIDKITHCVSTFLNISYLDACIWKEIFIVNIWTL